MKMTGSKCLLDTSIIIHLFKNPSQVFILDDYNDIYVSSTAIGELYYGAYISANPQKHINQILAFMDKCLIIHLTTETAIIYAQLKSALKRKGTPIPENDIWIAASSVEHDIPLFTNDNHFKSLKLNLISL
jgi:tRNA(fMet)-specific endonuclease VapC